MICHLYETAQRTGSIEQPVRCLAPVSAGGGSGSGQEERNGSIRRSCVSSEGVNALTCVSCLISFERIVCTGLPSSCRIVSP